jgi:hypothetical protein
VKEIPGVEDNVRKIRFAIDELMWRFRSVLRLARTKVR